MLYLALDAYTESMNWSQHKLRDVWKFSTQTSYRFVPSSPREFVREVAQCRCKVYTWWDLIIYKWKMIDTINCFFFSFGFTLIYTWSKIMWKLRRSGFSLRVIMKSDENLIFHRDIPQRIVLTLIENEGFPR